MPAPDQQTAAMLARLPEQTGKSLEEWKRVLTASGLQKHGQLVGLLKAEHGVTHGYANLIVHAFREAPAGVPAGDLVASQYAGKESLRPIYDRLIDAVGGFGDDVEIAPKKTYVSLRRRTQFALVQPSTRTRVDVGIKLEGVEPEGRLEVAGTFNAMVTHRVRVTNADEIDDELVGWLRRAYEGAGE